MAYDGKILARARQQLDKRREENQNEQQRRLRMVYLRVPEIQQIDQRLRSHMAELVKLTVSRSPDLAQRLSALERENLDLQMRKAELLVEKGWSADYLDEIISCEKCRDTGIYEGAPCRCLETLYNMELTKELGILLRNGDESFELFDLSLYPQSDELGQNPREIMKIVSDSCRRFAENFPEVGTNLLLQGGTGLGKTYLSACIAREIAKKGHSVCYDSAASALEAFELQKFSKDAEVAANAAARVRRMLDCDLMILDDLGTELVTASSTSALYTLINTRLVNGRRMIISTNCTDEELRRLYTPQICSRINGEFISLPFVGRDIRMMKKGV